MGGQKWIIDLDVVLTVDDILNKASLGQNDGGPITSLNELILQVVLLTHSGNNGNNSAHPECIVHFKNLGIVASCAKKNSVHCCH